MFNYEFRCAVWLVKILNKILSNHDLLPTFKKIIVNFKDVLDGYSKNVDCSFASHLTGMSEAELNEPLVTLDLYEDCGGVLGDKPSKIKTQRERK